MIGTNEFKHELRNVGLTVHGGEEDNEKLMNSEIFRKTVTDPEVEAVVLPIIKKFEIPHFSIFLIRSSGKMKDSITTSSTWLLFTY